MSKTLKNSTEVVASLRRQLARIPAFDLTGHEEKIQLLLALVVSAVVGLVVVAFLTATERLGSALTAAGPWRRLLSPFVGSLVGGWLLFRFFPDARGSGIPQTRIALLLRDGYISARTVVGKFLCSSIAMGSGVALGREGPSVQIGAGIASTAGRMLGLNEVHIRQLVPVGTAAAVAAAFNTPLAAVLFTLEEILSDLNARVVGTVVIGAATAWIVLRLMLGDEPLFHVPAYQLVHPVEFLIYALLGLVAGLIATVFVKGLLWQRARFLRVRGPWQMAMPAVGGLLTGLLALGQAGVLGVGYPLVNDALNGRTGLQLMLLLLALKVVATSTCYASGNAGGIFGPSLFIGAMTGGSVGLVAHQLLPELTGNAGAYALVGMGAAFAGIVRTPMTSVIMIFELTRDYTIIVPLMIANLCSYLVAQRLQHQPIYEALAAQEGVRMPVASRLPAPLTVADGMRPLAEGARKEGAPYAYPDDPLDSAMQRLSRSGTGPNELQVLSRLGGAVVGTLSLEDAVAAYGRRGGGLGEEDAAATNWLPAMAAAGVGIVLIGSGLVLWQRSHQKELSRQAYAVGEKALRAGQLDEAVVSFRTALAHQPNDSKARIALGLALVDAGQMAEAGSYLVLAAKGEQQNGPLTSGLARIAASAGDRKGAIQLYRRALAMNWPAGEETRYRNGELEFGRLLAGEGRRSEAVAVLMTLLEQSGDDAVTSRQAAAAVDAMGTPEQAEEAYKKLTAQFPSDWRAWVELGDVRLREFRDAPALEAYRRAAGLSPEAGEAALAVSRVEEILKLDPTQRGLPVRDRAEHWKRVLERVVAEGAGCAEPMPDGAERLAEGRALVSRRDSSIQAADQRMQAAIRIWKALPAACRMDSVVAHIMARLVV